MADFKRGIKAGVITGAIYAAVTLILAFTLADYQYLSPSGFWEATGLVSYAFVGLIIRGIVFGAIFAALYNFLPGPTAIVKGVELSFSFWVLTVIEVAYRNLTWPWQAAVVSGDFTYYGGTINLSSVSLGLISVASALVFGVLVGFFWNRFSGKEPREERKGRPVLLVSFILGVIAWAVVSGLYIRWAVVTGAPFPGVLFFSWYTMLGPPVSVAGLIGWLFALAAWRKTRRGESGFGWGLAGGILMVLTGLMLLPGALAITGAVLSRQTPEETAEKKAVAASQRQMRTGMRRNLALLIITVVMLVVVVVVGFTIPTATGTYTQVTTDRYSSTAVSRYGLSLTISLNSTTLHPGEQISVEIQEKNILPARNGLRAAHRWPVGGLTLSPCGLLEGVL
jgi:hypothetical protein